MNNNALPEIIRAFVAVYPEEPVAAKLRFAQQRLRLLAPGRGIRWTPPEQLHLTLHFLGNVAGRRAGEFEAALRTAAARTAPFTLRAESLGYFPPGKRPRVLWAGLTGEIEALGRLKAVIEEALAPLGFSPEDRPFRPHLTLGRVKEMRPSDAGRLSRELSGSEGLEFGEWRVERVWFMRSELSGVGARHTTLFTLGLTGSGR